MRAPYTIRLLDYQGDELSNTEEASIGLARLVMREKLTSPTYGDAVRVVITDADDDVIEDREAEAKCIGCRCTDCEACIGGCAWLRVNRWLRRGVCSNCSEHIKRFDAGDCRPSQP